MCLLNLDIFSTLVYFHIRILFKIRKNKQKIRKRGSQIAPRKFVGGLPHNRSGPKTMFW